MRRIDKEISALLRLVQTTRESLESITQNYNSDGAQVTKDPHKFDRLIELEALVDSKVDEQIELKAEILRTIMQLDDRRQRLVLMEYYIEMKTFEEIAVDIHYSWKQTHRIHANALKAIDHFLAYEKPKNG